MFAFPIRSDTLCHVAQFTQRLWRVSFRYSKNSDWSKHGRLASLHWWGKSLRRSELRESQSGERFELPRWRTCSLSIGPDSHATLYTNIRPLPQLQQGNYMNGIAHLYKISSFHSIVNLTRSQTSSHSRNSQRIRAMSSNNGQNHASIPTTIQLPIDPYPFYIATLLGGILITSLTHAPIPFLPRLLTVTTGTILIAVGAYFNISSKRALDRHHTAPEHHKGVSALVTDGVFRISRNPIYLAGILVSLGVGIVGNNYWGVAVVLPWWTYCIAVVIPAEETTLKAKFGPVYQDYCRTVRRWI